MKLNGSAPPPSGGARDDVPRVGQIIDLGAWRKVKIPFKDQTLPFEWAEQGEWFVMYSNLDGVIYGIAKLYKGLWEFRMEGGLRIRERTQRGIVKKMGQLQHKLVEELVKQ